MANQGIFIALEGVDGSGKGTQFKLLTERLRAVGYDVEIFDFPRYEEPSSHFVRRYLNGEYGPASEVSPYSAALFYALDRFEAAPNIRKALDAGKIVLSNRYTGSSMAHQGSKFSSEAEQRGFFIWVESLEYQLLNIPRPNVSIFLRVPAEVSYALIEQKHQRDYTNKKRDEHEADFEHLQRSLATYDTLCRLFPKDFLAIECTADDKLQSIPAINDLIWQTIRYFLPQKPPHRGRGTVVKLDTPAEPTPQLAKIQPTSADPSPKGTPLSLIGLIELAKAQTGSPKLSDEQLSGLNDYYLPPGLDSKIEKRYRALIDELINKRQALHNKLGSKKTASDNRILAALTPMAARTTVELTKDDLAIVAGSSKLAELRVQAKQAKSPKKKASLNRLENLLLDRMSPNQSTDLEPLTLLEFWPRNEFDILGSGLYGLTDLPRQEVQSELETWTYEQKYQSLTEFLAQIEPAIARQVRYSWDVIAPQSLLLELAGTNLLQNLQVQVATPRYGYEVPRSLDEAALSDHYIESFDLSLKLYSELQSAGHEDIAPYATLAGHKTRFQFSCDLDGLARLGENDSKIIKLFRKNLINKLGEAQPIIADYLRAQAKVVPQHQPAKSKPTRRRRGKK